MMGAKLDKLGAREKVGLAVAFLCLALVLLDNVVVRPVLRRLQDLDVQIHDEQKGLRDNRRILQWEPSVSAAYERISGMLARTSSEASQSDEMKGEVDALARQAGVAIVSMKDRELQKQEFVEEYAVEIDEFEADITALLSFLHEIQKSPGMLRVVRLNVTPGKSRTTVKGSMLITKAMVASEGASPEPRG
jgi:hypothetical protein